MRLCTPLALLISLAACGGDSPTGTPDAKVTGDAAMASVVAVTCPASAPIVTTTTSGADAYVPASTTISVGGIVKFMMPAAHDVAPNTLKPTDDGLKVDFGGTRCLQFNKAGTFNFFCTAHTFVGSITVQ